MIKFTRGNILQSDSMAIVNTVNCVGVMGKGLALQFKKEHPQNFIEYKEVCERKELVPGKIFVYHTKALLGTQYILNFPTKRHWKDKSQIDDIAIGLKNMIGVLNNYNISSVSVPALGCGLGGLDWGDVKKLILDTFNNSNITIVVYEP